MTSRPQMRRILPFSTAALAAALLLTAAPAPARDAQLSSQGTQASGTAAMPSPGYTGQTWVSPQGCSYSRAQAPGYAPTWHLILNGDKAGMTRAHRRCPSMLGAMGQL